jgi:hypothetical protein
MLQRGTLDVPARGRAARAADGAHPACAGRSLCGDSRQGVLFHDGRRDRFEAGDLMFVAAGTEHRFEDFSEDLAVWVIFYGPPGGEIPR